MNFLSMPIVSRRGVVDVPRSPSSIPGSPSLSDEHLGCDPVF